MHTGAIIDLGDDWAAPSDQHGGRPHRLGQPSMPRWVTLLLFPVLLVLLGGSTVQQPVLEPLWSLTAGASYVNLSGSRVFVLSRQSSTTAAIAAYRVADGGRLWRTPLPEGADWQEAMPGAGIVLAFRATGSVAALSTATGQLRWRAADVSIANLLPDDQRLLAINHEDDSGDDLELLDLTTGQPRWSQRITTGTQIAVALDGSGQQSIGWVVAQAPDGTIRIIDQASGRTLRTTKLPAPAEGNGGDTALLATNQLMLTLTIRTSDTTVIAYDPVTLERRWETEVAGVWYPRSSCGPVICIDSTNGLAALDPATGSVRWTADGWTVGGLVGDTLAVIGNRNTDRLAFIEPMSGRLHPVPGRWSPLSFPVRTMFASAKADGSGLWLGILDHKASTIRPVGWLADAGKGQCQINFPAHTHLACRTIHGDVQVWRYDSPVE